MLNQIVLVGRLTKDPTVENEEGRSVCTITLAIPRSVKNSEGIYDTDFIECVLWNGIAENTCKYCKQGDLVGVKGRVQRKENEEMVIVAEKLTFLTSSKKQEGGDE